MVGAFLGGCVGGLVWLGSLFIFGWSIAGAVIPFVVGIVGGMVISTR